MITRAAQRQNGNDMNRAVGISLILIACSLVAGIAYGFLFPGDLLVLLVPALWALVHYRRPIIDTIRENIAGISLSLLSCSLILVAFYVLAHVQVLEAAQTIFCGQYEHPRRAPQYIWIWRP